MGVCLRPSEQASPRLLQQMALEAGHPHCHPELGKWPSGLVIVSERWPSFCR